MKTYLKLASAPVAIGVALISMPAFAQDADDTASAETIVVTGSRIARPDLEAPSPVTMVSAEQVELTGTTNLETLLNELPQVIPGNTRVSNNSGGENFATLDLRGLGPSRTLILLDGERLPASTTTGVTDISQIPTGLIQRIDVVTGGASAVYGSDAIAGVVNFILKDNFEGLEMTGQYGLSEDGTGPSYTISGLMGGNFADGRGNFTVYASWTDRNAVSQGRYGYSAVSGALYAAFDDVTDAVTRDVFIVDNPSDLANPPSGSTFFPIAGGGSATPPWGFVANNPANPFQNLSTLLPATFGAGTTDTNCDGVAGGAVNGGNISWNDAGQLAPRNAAGLCNIPLRSIGSSRFNFGPLNYLITPYDRLSITATGRYEFSDSTRVKVYTSFTNANQQVALAPTPAGGGTAIIVPADSPLIPADLRAALNSRPDPNAPFTLNRRFSETGPRIGDFTTDAKNFRAVLEQDINENWAVNVIGSFGRIDNKIRNQGNIRRSAVVQGLSICPAGSGPGCVPLNLFGPNTLTSDMLSFVALTTTDTESFEQLRVAANFTGSLFELPGGRAGVAFGMEYRKDTGATFVDDAKRTGDIIGFNAQNDVVGSINVKEVYGEIRLPVLDMLSIGAGARYSDYSSVGGLFNWKAEAEFTPTDWIKVRGSFNRAARAPNVFELFQNGNQGFPAYVDPCNDTVNRSAATLAVCQGQAPGFNFTGFQQGNGQVQAFAFGSPDLSEEKAETWTVGAVFTPGNVLGGKITASVDYYNIKLTNRVAALGATFFISQCYNSVDPLACNRILRNSATGEIDEINTSTGNSDVPLKTSGVDVGLDWTVPAFGGKISLSDVFTYVDEYKIGATEFADTVFGGIGGVTHKYGNTATLSYRTGGFTGQIRHVWKRGAKQNFPGADLEGLFAGSGRIPDLSLWNLSLRQQVNDNFELTMIVNNLLDKYPPQTANGFFEQANTNISFYDAYALGRTWTVQARVKF